MHKAPKLIGVAVLILTVAACAALSPEERARYEKLPAVSVNKAGDWISGDLKTRPWVIQSFSGSIPPDAKAVALWFPGGEGLGGNMGLDGVLIRNGIGFVNVAPSSDWPRGFVCCDSPFRDSTLHLTDVEAVIGYLKKETGLPIWLIGLSMGTVSIANVATRRPEAIDGVVFLSSVTSFNVQGNRPRGETLVTEMALSRITVPVLAAAHAQDDDTPPSGASTIVQRVTNAPVKEVKIFSEGPDVRPYGGGSGYVPHTFAGKRHELAEHIAKFILANTRARPPVLKFHRGVGG